VKTPPATVLVGSVEASGATKRYPGDVSKAGTATAEGAMFGNLSVLI
jgi:hypothetical protein